MAHPALLGEGADAADTWEKVSSNVTWTLDMDDFLRAAVRSTSFDFEAAARQIQAYVLRLRACGGILPDDVVGALYTPQACRERWAHLDFRTCCALSQPAEHAIDDDDDDDRSAVPATAMVAEQGASDRAATHSASDDSGSGDADDDDDDDDYGIVDLDALRAQRLKGLFGAAPSSTRSAKPASNRATSARAQARANPSSVGSTGTSERRSGSRRPPTVESAAVADVPGVAFAADSAIGPPSNGTGAMSHGFTGSAQRVAELEQLAAALSAQGGGSPQNGTAAHLTTARTATDVAPQHREAAATLVEPLGELKRRMQGLEALLEDEATDMAAKLGEIAQVSREMADLQSLAHRCQAQQSPLPAQQLASSDQSIVAATPDDDPTTWLGHPPTESQAVPLSIAPSTTVNLEAALDGLDIDGLLARLEAGEEL